MKYVLYRVYEQLLMVTTLGRLIGTAEERQEAIQRYVDAYPKALAEVEAQSNVCTEFDGPFTPMSVDAFNERFIKPMDFEKHVKQIYAKLPRYTVQDDIKHVRDYLVWLALYIRGVDEGDFDVYWVEHYEDYYTEFIELHPHLQDAVPTYEQIAEYHFPDWVFTCEVDTQANRCFNPNFGLPDVMPYLDSQRIVRHPPEPVEVTWLDEDPFEACEIPF